MKRQTPTDQCSWALFPLGKGLPLCAYYVFQQKKLGKMTDPKLQDFPVCPMPKQCFRQEKRKDEIK